MPLPNLENKITRPSMRDEVYNTLLNWIMEGILRPGEKVVDKELGELLGVSRTPVREALRRLEDKSLIESSANRWTRVTEISPREPEMIYPIIWTLENLALTEAGPHLREQDFEEMERANKELKAAIAANDPLAASKADAAFHDVIIERSLNTHLIMILQDLKVRYRRLEVVYFEGAPYEESSFTEHEAIIASLKNGEQTKAGEILHSNWKKSLERMRTTLLDKEIK